MVARTYISWKCEQRVAFAVKKALNRGVKRGQDDGYFALCAVHRQLRTHAVCWQKCPAQFHEVIVGDRLFYQEWISG